MNKQEWVESLWKVAGKIVVEGSQATLALEDKAEFSKPCKQKVKLVDTEIIEGKLYSEKLPKALSMEEFFTQLDELLSLFHDTVLFIYDPRPWMNSSRVTITKNNAASVMADVVNFITSDYFEENCSDYLTEWNLVVPKGLEVIQEKVVEATKNVLWMFDEVNKEMAEYNKNRVVGGTSSVKGKDEVEI